MCLVDSETEMEMDLIFAFQFDFPLLVEESVLGAVREFQLENLPARVEFPRINDDAKIAETPVYLILKNPFRTVGDYIISDDRGYGLKQFY